VRVALSVFIEVDVEFVALSTMKKEIVVSVVTSSVAHISLEAFCL
jgi:hypothetical protein